MKRFLNFIGSGFVYKSPNPYEGFKRFLLYLPSKQLRYLADSRSHCSKEKLVQLYFKKNALTKIQNQRSS